MDLATIKEVPVVRPWVDSQPPDPVGLASTSDSDAGGASMEEAIDGGVLLARSSVASEADDPWRTLETPSEADGLPSELHVNSMRMHKRFADGQIECGGAAARPRHEWHKAVNAEAWGPPPDFRPDASARHPEAESTSPRPPFGPRPTNGTDTVRATNDAIQGTPRGHLGSVRRGMEESIENADPPVASSIFVGTDPDPVHDVTRRDRSSAGPGFREHERPTTIPAAAGPELNWSSVQVATEPVPSRETRDKRRTGRPARADHLLFPKAREWLATGHSFESVAEFCDEFCAWLKEFHPGCSMEPGSIGGAFRKRGEDLLNALCPPVRGHTAERPTPRECQGRARLRRRRDGRTATRQQRPVLMTRAALTGPHNAARYDRPSARASSSVRSTEVS